MIAAEQLTEIGTFGHPHGIKGEISATIDIDVDMADLRCIVVDVDGIYVPFFITAIRPRSAQSLLLTIDGITNETEAAQMTNKTIFALTDELPEIDDEQDGDGFYAEDLIGFTISDADGKLSGEITAIDDATDNVLFIVSTDKGDVLIPVADEFIVDIDTDNNHLIVNLPQGLLDI